MAKVPSGGAIVMALAALEILDMTERIDEVLDVERFVPAVGQGCVAVECRVDDASTLDALATVDHVPTRRRVEVERAFLGERGSGCSLPVGGHVIGDELHVFLADPDRGTSVNDVVALGPGPTEAIDELELARATARRLQERLG